MTFIMYFISIIIITSDPWVGEGNGNLLQFSFLGNPVDRGAWWATVHGVTKRHDLVTKQQQGTKSGFTLLRVLKEKNKNIANN